MSNANDIALEVIRVVHSAFALYGTTYIVIGFTSPEWFLQTFSFDRKRCRRWSQGEYIALQDDEWSRYGGNRWIDWPITWLTFISIFIVTFAAVYPLIDAIPYDWGLHDEDGDWMSTRTWIQSLIGLLGAVHLCDRTERNALELARSRSTSDQ